MAAVCRFEISSVSQVGNDASMRSATSVGQLPSHQRSTKARSARGVRNERKKKEQKSYVRPSIPGMPRLVVIM